MATRHRHFILNKRYGVAIADYNRLFDKQGGVCKICKRSPKKYRLSIDHNHQTNEVRGLLCVSCNRALGRLEPYWDEFHRFVEHSRDTTPHRRKIYVAAKYEDRARAQAIMAQLEQANHTITYNWAASEQVSPEQALLDRKGVLSADTFVLVAEKDYPYCGALVELGLALGAHIPVFVLGHALDHCIFMQLPEINRGIDLLLN